MREHLSAIKGGRLATAAAPARSVTLMISDVPGDDPAVVASGPTVSDPTTRADAFALLERYAIDVPERVTTWLSSPECESPKPDDAVFSSLDLRMIATPQMALEAAAATLQAASRFDRCTAHHSSHPSSVATTTGP